MVLRVHGTIRTDRAGQTTSLSDRDPADLQERDRDLRNIQQLQ